MRGPVLGLCDVYLYARVCMAPLQKMRMQLQFFITSENTFHELFAPHAIHYICVALTDSPRAVLFC